MVLATLHVHTIEAITDSVALHGRTKQKTLCVRKSTHRESNGFKGLSLHVVFMLIPMLHNHKREQHAENLRNLAQIVESGRLKPVLDSKRYSLDQAGQAHARLESGQAMGKVVVEN